jgi:hypothetical protein
MNIMNSFRFPVTGVVVASLAATIGFHIPIASAEQRRPQGYTWNICQGTYEGPVGCNGVFCSDDTGDVYCCPSKDSKPEECTLVYNRPMRPRQNPPIKHRGVEGEPATTAPAGQEEKVPAPK